MIGIKFDQLKNKEKLQDGDKIIVQTTEDSCDKDHIEIGLELGPDVKWWKGIQLDQIVVAQCQDSQSSLVSKIGYESFLDHKLNFWKAKTFGAHSEMYTVIDAPENMKPGNKYLFRWLKD